jgi:catechol 2,3-dioxygenase-like lactoylglutathione lyase family enzyme
MKKKYLLPMFLINCGCFFQSANAELPEFYKDVHHIIWVVEDLEPVTSGWKSLGFNEIRDLGILTITENNDRMSTAKAACGHLGGTRVLWLESIKGKNIFTKFHKIYGDGVFSLVHLPGSTVAFEKEVVRLKSHGIEQVEKVQFHSDLCDIIYAFAMTYDKGKYNLGLLEDASEAYFADDLKGGNTLGMEFSQYAFAINDPAPVSAFWSTVGFPEMKVDPSIGHDKTYHGSPADFEMELGWQRHGQVVYEWCIPLKSPNVYADHIKEHGEGFQHLGFRVSDMDEAVKFMESRGLSVVQSGGWGEKGKPNSGKYAYIDTTPYGGANIELLWSYKD